jgi:predicted nucleic acid-binding protein
MEKMESVCLDTDILIDHLRGKTETVEKIKELEGKYRFSTTVINSFELYYGAYKTRKRKFNVLSVDKILGRLSILQMDKDTSKFAGKILADLEGKGEIIDFRDALIASIVITRDIILFTRNIKHFSKIKGIKLYNDEG